LLSYFTAERGEKAWEMIRESARIEWEYIPNEFGALVREMRLIQRASPKYNVQHRRKRAYAFVKVTKERAPRVLPVTRVTSDGSIYFGPFPKVGRVRDAVRDLSYVMKLRDCPGTTPISFDDQMEIFGGGDRAPLCMRADLGTCLAPCSGGVSSTEYARRVNQTVRFLEGRGREPLAVLERGMSEAARRMEFEYAALLCDRHERLARLQEELSAWRGRVDSLNFLYRVPGFRGADRLYFVRKGLVRGWARHPKSEDARRKVAERVREAFGSAGAVAGGPGRPTLPERLTPHQAAETLLVARWFRLKRKELKRTTTPEEWLRSVAA
jgi:excinuclease ABC subunit C